MNRNEFARNLAAGTYGLVVLDVLRDGPGYGYGIVNAFSSNPGTQSAGNRARSTLSCIAWRNKVW
jgi:hypothetical protein